MTRITDPAELVGKHLLDALAALPRLDDLGDRLSVVDVGAGGGVPGLPLALARPAWRVTLIEATARKAEFLRETSRSLGLGDRVAVRAERVEACGRDPALREAHDAAVARAVGRVATVLELTLPLVRPGGRVVLYRGPSDAAAEREAAERAAPLLGGGEVIQDRIALPGGAQRVLLSVAKLAPTEARYPRRDGVPAKRPLA